MGGVRLPLPERYVMFNIQVDIDFMTVYVYNLINLLTINGVPLYLLVIALIAVAFFVAFAGHLIDEFIERVGR